MCVLKMPKTLTLELNSPNQYLQPLRAAGIGICGEIRNSTGLYPCLIASHRNSVAVRGFWLHFFLLLWRHPQSQIYNRISPTQMPKCAAAGADVRADARLPPPAPPHTPAADNTRRTRAGTCIRTGGAGASLHGPAASNEGQTPLASDNGSHTHERRHAMGSQVPRLPLGCLRPATRVQEDGLKRGCLGILRHLRRAIWVIIMEQGDLHPL